MPKGKKSRKNTKNRGHVQAKRALVMREDEQEYGQVLKVLGNLKLMCHCMDGTERICHIRGKMRKRCWIQEGDYILVSLRDFDPDKADVIHKYKGDEVAQLRKMGELPPEEEDDLHTEHVQFFFSDEEDEKDNVVNDDVAFNLI